LDASKSSARGWTWCGPRDLTLRASEEEKDARAGLAMALAFPFWLALNTPFGCAHVRSESGLLSGCFYYFYIMWLFCRFVSFQDPFFFFSSPFGLDREEVGK
jgi:hypothetical protein